MKPRHLILIVTAAIILAGCGHLPDAMQPIEFGALPMDAQTYVLREVPNASSYRPYRIDSTGEAHCYVVFMSVTPTNTISMVFDVQGEWQATSPNKLHQGTSQERRP